MKKFLKCILLLLPVSVWSQVDVSGTINQKANEKTGEAIDAIWNSPGKDKEDKKEKSKKEKADSASTTGKNSTAGGNATQSGNAQTNPNVKTYQNYDFVAGSELVFADDFASDVIGEFPAHWEIDNGQGVVNVFDNRNTLFITDGGEMHPRIVPETYLSGESWTVETDTYVREEDYGIKMWFYNGNQSLMYVATSTAYVTASFPKTTGGEEAQELTGNIPVQAASGNYVNKWHHIAIAYKNGQMKIYIDENRVLVVPDCHCKPTRVTFCGMAQEGAPIKFTNVRIANGGNQNMLNALNTNGKIISYGITFDVNKSDIKPESMGALNEIAKLMKDNPALKLEIGGYTDSDGDDASNLKLSQQRADAVKAQLVSLGIDGSRLTTKGYGETKPLAPNTSFEGKAKNRRVEFVKL